MRLTDQEQRHVRTALRFLRLTDVSIDDLLASALLSPRTCPHCGRPPDDFADEKTVVTNRASISSLSSLSGLTVIDGGDR